MLIRLDRTAMGNILSTLRAERGLTRWHVADTVGITVNTLLGYEKGRTFPSADVVAALADFYSVSADVILCRAPYIGGVNYDGAGTAELQQAAASV